MLPEHHDGKKRDTPLPYGLGLVGSSVIRNISGIAD